MSVNSSQVGSRAWLRTAYGRPLPEKLVNVGTDDSPIIFPLLLAESMAKQHKLDTGHKSHISNEYDRIFKK